MTGKPTVPSETHDQIRGLAAAGKGRKLIMKELGCSNYTVRKALDPDFGVREAARHRAREARKSNEPGTAEPVLTPDPAPPVILVISSRSAPPEGDDQKPGIVSGLPGRFDPRPTQGDESEIRSKVGSVKRGSDAVHKGPRRHRSIGDRMQRAKSLDARHETASDWAANWQAEHDGLIRDLERLIGRGRLGEAGQVLGQLKAMHIKRFGALQRVVDALADEDVF